MEGKRKGISLKDKYSMVIRIRGGETQTEIAKAFGIRKSTISGIWKKRELIMKAYEGHNLYSMRMRSCNDKIDRQLYTWYRARINANLPINGKFLKQKAEEIAHSFGENFTCTPRWLDKFKNRHGILFKSHKNHMDQENFKHNFWPFVRSDYKDENIFTVREVGIFFNSFPHDALDLCCDNGELASSRFTVCICANMTGTEKRPLLVVGNKACVVGLPLQYRCNRKCWMNLALSLEQLTTWNKELISLNRNVILLVKFSPAFRSFADLSHVKIGYFPQDLSVHPLDPAMGELKFFYRKYLLDFKNLDNINPIQSIRFLYKSWLRVAEETISGGFQILNGHCEQKSLSLVPWAIQKGISVKNIDDCLTFDNNLVTSVHFLSEAVGIGEPLQSSDSDDMEESAEQMEEISLQEALNMARSLAAFIESKGDKTLLESIVNIEHYIEDKLDNLSVVKEENVEHDS